MHKCSWETVRWDGFYGDDTIFVNGRCRVCNEIFRAIYQKVAVYGLDNREVNLTTGHGGAGGDK